MDARDVILCFCLLGLYIQCSLQIQLRNTNCTTNEVCKNKDPNAQCHTVITNGVLSGFCECRENYLEKSGVCKERVLERNCTTDRDCLTQEMPNVVCNASNMCVCEPGYGSYQEETCTKVLGRPCVANGGCDRFLGNTSCFSDAGVFKCSCIRTHIEEYNVCKTRLDGSCVLNEDCVQHGTCNLGNNKCKCLDGYHRFHDICAAGSGRPGISVLTCVFSMVIVIVLRYVYQM